MFSETSRKLISDVIQEDSNKVDEIFSAMKTLASHFSIAKTATANNKSDLIDILLDLNSICSIMEVLEKVIIEYEKSIKKNENYDFVINLLQGIDELIAIEDKKDEDKSNKNIKEQERQEKKKEQKEKIDKFKKAIMAKLTPPNTPEIQKKPSSSPKIVTKKKNVIENVIENMMSDIKRKRELEKYDSNSIQSLVKDKDMIVSRLQQLTSVYYFHLTPDDLSKYNDSYILTKNPPELVYIENNKVSKLEFTFDEEIEEAINEFTNDIKGIDEIKKAKREAEELYNHDYFANDLFEACDIELSKTNVNKFTCLNNPKLQVKLWNLINKNGTPSYTSANRLIEEEIISKKPIISKLVKSLHAILDSQRINIKSYKDIQFKYVYIINELINIQIEVDELKNINNLKTDLNNKRDNELSPLESEITNLEQQINDKIKGDMNKLVDEIKLLEEQVDANKNDSSLADDLSNKKKQLEINIAYILINKKNQRVALDAALSKLQRKIEKIESKYGDSKQEIKKATTEKTELYKKLFKERLLSSIKKDIGRILGLTGQTRVISLDKLVIDIFNTVTADKFLKLLVYEITPKDFNTMLKNADLLARATSADSIIPTSTNFATSAISTSYATSATSSTSTTPVSPNAITASSTNDLEEKEDEALLEEVDEGLTEEEDEKSINMNIQANTTLSGNIRNSDNSFRLFSQQIKENENEKEKEKLSKSDKRTIVKEKENVPPTKNTA